MSELITLYAIMNKKYGLYLRGRTKYSWYWTNKPRTFIRRSDAVQCILKLGIQSEASIVKLTAAKVIEGD